jgi:DNA-binding response OmpR family regulator
MTKPETPAEVRARWRAHHERMANKRARERRECLDAGKDELAAMYEAMCIAEMKLAKGDE